MFFHPPFVKARGAVGDPQRPGPGATPMFPRHRPSHASTGRSGVFRYWWPRTLRSGCKDRHSRRLNPGAAARPWSRPTPWCSDVRDTRCLFPPSLTVPNEVTSIKEAVISREPFANVIKPAFMPSFSDCRRAELLRSSAQGGTDPAIPTAMSRSSQNSLLVSFSQKEVKLSQEGSDHHPLHPERSFPGSCWFGLERRGRAAPRSAGLRAARQLPAQLRRLFTPGCSGCCAPGCLCLLFPHGSDRRALRGMRHAQRRLSV